MFERILVAHDGSDGAQKAFDTAVELTLRLHASLHMISVEEDLPRYAETMLEVDEEKEVEDTYFGQLRKTRCPAAVAQATRYSVDESTQELHPHLTTKCGADMHAVQTSPRRHVAETGRARKRAGSGIGKSAGTSSADRIR